MADNWNLNQNLRQSATEAGGKPAQICRNAQGAWRRGSDSVELHQKRTGTAFMPSLFFFGGDNWNRTSDLLHVKQAL